MADVDLMVIFQEATGNDQAEVMDPNEFGAAMLKARQLQKLH